MFRYAVLSAVSTDSQAHEDKASLDDQVLTARRAGEQQGGVESAGPFVLDGYSRTGYVNLSDALADIPPLAAALNAAEQNQYDVLVVDNIERLGDLAPMISTMMKKYRKQIHSARQPSRIFDPQEYDPFSDESSDILIHVEGIIQKYRLNKLRRGYEAGMPKRIERGLTPLSVPFGYIHAGSKEPPKLDPPRAVLLQQMKDMLLTGRTLRAIADFADGSGIAPPRGGSKWDLGSLKYMLANPYYAGTVGTRRTKYIYDARRKRKRRAIQQPRAKWLEGQGRHEPLWDEATHRAIVQEFKRRYEVHKNFSNRFPLSGLLTCSVCRRKLHRRTHGHGSLQRIVFSCAVGPSDIILPYNEVLDLVANELVRQLSEEPETSSSAHADPNYSQAAIDQLEQERKRIQAGFRSGIYKEAEASAEIRKIEDQIETIRHQAEEKEYTSGLREELLDQLGDNLQYLPDMIRDFDPQIVNRLLSALCRDIIIHPDKRVEIIPRDP